MNNGIMIKKEKMINKIIRWLKLKWLAYKFPDVRVPYSIEYVGTYAVERYWYYARHVLKLEEAMNRDSIDLCHCATYTGYCDKDFPNPNNDNCYHDPPAVILLKKLYGIYDNYISVNEIKYYIKMGGIAYAARCIEYKMSLKNGYQKTNK